MDTALQHKLFVFFLYLKRFGGLDDFIGDAAGNP